MKIKPFDPTLKPEPMLVLKMGESPTGGVMLRACDSTNGHCINEGIILTVAENGIVRHSGVSPGLGLPLDDAGRVVVKDRYQRLPPKAAKVAQVLTAFIRGTPDDYVVLSTGPQHATAADIKALLRHLDY